MSREGREQGKRKKERGELNKPDGWKVRAWQGMLKQHEGGRGVKRREDRSVGWVAVGRRSEEQGREQTPTKQVAHPRTHGPRSTLQLCECRSSSSPFQFASISIVAVASKFVPKSTAMKIMSPSNPTGSMPLVGSRPQIFASCYDESRQNLVGPPFQAKMGLHTSSLSLPRT